MRLEDGAHGLFEPGDPFFPQAVTGGRALDLSLDPARLPQDLEMLGNGRLGDGQVVHDVAGDAAGMGEQKLQDFKANGMTQRLAQGDQLGLFIALDGQGAAGDWKNG